MNQLPSILLFLSLAGGLALPTSSCALFDPNATEVVDDLVIFEPAQLAWSDIRDDLDRGFADGENEGTLDADAAAGLRAARDNLEAAIRDKDRDALRMVPWHTLKPWAERGIDAQLSAEIVGPGVAESFHEHLRNFDLTMQRLRGTTTP